MDTVNYQALAFAYRRSPDQDAVAPVRHPVVVVGAGPVGLALAIDLAQRGVPVVLLDNDNRLSTGSRAICFAKRTLEIFDRLGVGERMVGKGVSWNVGRVFFGEEQVYRFDLLPEAGHERPAFINLQQYYVEGFLAERAAELPAIDLRWKHKVVGVEQHADHAVLTVETPEGSYRLEADYVAACDGSRSSVRSLIGQESTGRVFRDRFLIADIKLPPGAEAGFPAERWFWFDPPFHRGQSVLLHMQPDGVWRIDFQLGWDADPEREKRPEHIVPRVQALFANTPMAGLRFELEWASVYTFACQRMASFRHGRVLFAGDSAHGVSPFGARGANSGVQDAENLAWKLALVLAGRAPDALLDSYASEREAAADENILNSTRSTDFITPKSEVSRLFRDAVLQLARTQPFARAMVNSGRLSVPATLGSSPLNTSLGPCESRLVAGAPAVDAPLRTHDGRTTWLLRELGDGFTALVHVESAPAWTLDLVDDVHGLKIVRIAGARLDGLGSDASTLIDEEGLLCRRYDLQPGGVLLLRPDRHLCARLQRPDLATLRAAVTRAMALEVVAA